MSSEINIVQAFVTPGALTFVVLANKVHKYVLGAATVFYRTCISLHGSDGESPIAMTT